MVTRLSLFAILTKIVASIFIYANEIPKILRLMTIAQESQTLLSNRYINRHEDERYTDNTKQKEKTRMKQRNMTKKLNINVAQID